jgi:SAM-dependent methyltransferase
VLRLSAALADWHRRRISVPRAERISASLAALLRREAPIESLLDVGSGDGWVARQLAETLAVREVRGVDVQLQPSASIAVERYDGTTLPLDDGSVDAVVLSDVLHHADDPDRLLREALRVARKAVAIKDHFAIGPLSRGVLWAMDVVGNAHSGVAVTGHYASPAQWRQRIEQAGGTLRALHWPLEIHDLPWRAVSRSELQFSALVKPARR